MTIYDLLLESGPKHRKTMVHVLDLLGCIAVGPMTQTALENTPDAIRAYLRFLKRHGEAVEPESPFETQVAEHITEGEWLGNGSPYLVFPPDLQPVTWNEMEIYLNRLQGIFDELTEWIATQAAQSLGASPAGGGRPAEAIILHVLGANGSYLSSPLNGAPGFGKIHGAAERGEIALPVALQESVTLASQRVWAATSEQRERIRDTGKATYTLRKALRRMLEHSWEHLAELSRRPGGPPL